MLKLVVDLQGAKSVLILKDSLVVGSIVIEDDMLQIEATAPCAVWVDNPLVGINFNPQTDGCNLRVGE